jgi:hypothetical protein
VNTYDQGICQNLRQFPQQLWQVFFVGLTIGMQRTVLPALVDWCRRQVVCRQTSCNAPDLGYFVNFTVPHQSGAAAGFQETLLICQ